MEHIKRIFGWIGGIALALLAWYSVVPTIILRVICWKKRRETLWLGRKVIYLTFEDGPSIEYTTELLDLLKQYEIKATFFVVAAFAFENPVLIQKMKKAGHSIQLHCLTHTNNLILDPISTAQNLSLALDMMEQMRVKVSVVRPTGGCINLSMLSFLKKNSLKLAFDDVTVGDRKRKRKQGRVVDQLFARIRPGSIVSFHDGRVGHATPEYTIEILKIMLPVWKNSGYEFHLIR